MVVPAETPLQDENPYASPLAAGEVANKFPAQLWRFGDVVVAHRQADWPNLCVKTGDNCSNSQKIPIATQYPNWMLFPLFGIPWLGMVVSLFLPKSAASLYIGLGILAVCAAGFVSAVVLIFRMAKPTRIEIFVSPKYMSQRRSKLRIANALTVLGILGSAVSLLLLMPFGGVRMVLFFASIVVIAIGGSYRSAWRRILRPTKTKPEYIVLRGAGEAFLSRLESWPYGPL